MRARPSDPAAASDEQAEPGGPRLDGVEAVFFDVDDTLYDFARSVQETLLHLRSRFPDLLGGYGDDALVSAYYRANNSMTEAEKLALIERDPALYRRATWEAFLRFHDGAKPKDGEALGAALAEEFGAWRFRNLKRSAFAGSDETVRAFAKRYRVGIITNGPSSLQRAKIAALGYEGFFPEDMVLVSGEFGERKPHRSIFEAATRRAGVAPERCVMIGDSLECDIPSRAVGWRAVLFHGRGGPEPDLAPWPHAPDHVVRSYSELRRLFKE